MFGGDNPRPNPFGSTGAAPVFGAGSGPAPNVNPFASASGPSSAPAFGSSSTSTLAFGGGSQQTSAQPFGGSSSAPVFGATTPATGTAGAFGATPTFGSMSQGFGSSSTFGTATTTSSGGGFGSTASQASGFGTSATPPSAVVFGSTQSVNNVFGTAKTEVTASGFGSQATVSTSSSFGSMDNQPANVFGTVSSQTPMFGTTNTQTTASVFGGMQTVPIFGAPHTQTNVFGASVFGTATTSTTTNVFGTSNSQATSVFGTGQTQATASVFGAGNTQTTASVFGAGNTQTTASVFGAGNTQTTASVFGAGSTQTAGVFGAASENSQQSSGGFGTASTSPNVFGTTTTGTFGTSNTQTTSAFGITSSGGFGGATAQTTASVFGSSGTQPTNVFGGVTTTSTNVFGTTTNQPNSVFGEPSTKSSSGVFGPAVSQSSSVFGSIASTVSSSVFGAGGSQQTTASVFGGATTAPVFGAPQTAAFGAPGFGTTTKPSPFGGAVFGATNTSSSSSNVFGGHVGMTSGSGNTEARTSSTTSTGRGPATMSSFSNAASVLAGSSKFSQQTVPTNTRQQQTSVFGGFSKQDQTAPNVFGKTSDESKPVFGKPTFGIKEEDATVPEKPSIFGGTRVDTGSTFGGTAAIGVATFGGNSGSQQREESSSSQPMKMLFGKPVATEAESQPEEGELEEGEDLPEQEQPGPSTSRSRSSPPRSRSSRDYRSGRDSGSRFSSQYSRSRFSRQFSSPKDITECTAIVCSRIPSKCFNKEAIRTHFSQVARPTRIYVNNVKGTVIVHFEDHESAKLAKQERYFDESFPAMVINWSTYKKKSTTTDPDRNKSQKDSARSSTSQDTERSSTGRDTERPSTNRDTERPSTSGDPVGTSRPWSKRSMFGTTVEEELASMRGKSTLNREKISFNDPPRDPPREESRDDRGEESKRKKLVRVKEVQGRKSRSQSPLPVRRDLLSGTAERPVSPKLPARSRERSASPSVSSPSQASMSTVGASSLATTVVTMSSLKQVVAKTTNDKFEALEDRDKLIKSILQTRKQRDLASAKVSIGTCPDMCPEKERYMREERRRLTIYEADCGNISSSGNPMVDHCRAVKEYTRSSADQDMALPHELRPPHVLDMTMNYLVNNVLDAGDDGRWEDWYEFLWNRTRGIRKDITQQQLCDMTTVTLVEKCCRFHIFCSERLCEEDMAVFDAKINNENLTKCLQTLKELYHDMRERHGVQCPNEAEFRAYMVLMNLNQGDILWEIQQLQERIRRHPDLVFVLKVHSVLNTNNYVQFFRLVPHASFLQACLMHRYFDQVRRHAIRAMARCYSARGMMPAEKLMVLLGFETEQEVLNFCSFHGLEINGQAQVVFKDFVNPDTNYVIQRAKLLIESKQGNRSVGEVVNGGPLPPNTLHEPISSFDDNGCFKPEALSITVDESETKEPVTQEATMQQSVQQESAAEARGSGVSPSTPSSEAVVPSQSRPQIVYSVNEIIKDIAKSLFVEVIDESATQIATTMLSKLNLFISLANSVINTMAAEVVDRESRSIAAEVIQEAQMEEMERKARQRAEESAARERATKAIVEALSQEVSDDQCKDIAHEEYRIVQQTLHHHRMNRCAQDVSEDLCHSTVEAEIQQVIQEFYATEVVRRREELEAFSKAVQMMRVGRYFRVWRNALAGRQRLKRDMLTFPPAPSMSTAVELVKHLVPDSDGATDTDIHLGKMARLTLLPPSEAYQNRQAMNASLLACRYLQELRNLRIWSPLDLVSTVGPGIMTERKEQLKKGGHIYWKLLLSLPSSNQSYDLDPDGLNDLGQLRDWLSAKLAHGAVPPAREDSQTSVWSLYTSHLDAQRTTSLHVCVRAVHGNISKDEVTDIEGEHHFTGSSAIMFVLTQPNLHQRRQSWWASEKQRLMHVLQALRRRPAVPLSVLCCHLMANEGTEQEIVTRLDLTGMMTEGVISDYNVSLLRNVEDVGSTTVLLNAVSWLSRRAPSPPRVTRESVLDYVDNLMGREFYGPVALNLADRRKKGLFDHSPVALVSLYKTVLRHLADTARDSDLEDLSWPPTECTMAGKDLPVPGWNSKVQLMRIADLILSADLPDLEREPPGEWLSACDMVWDYTEALLQRTGRRDTKMNSQIRWLLRRAKKNFNEFGSLFARDFAALPPASVIPWTDVVLAWIDHQMDTLKENLADHEEETGEPVYVCYDPEKLKKVPKDATWWKARKTDDTDSSTLEDTVVKSVKRKHVSSSHKPTSKMMRLREEPPSSPGLDLEVPAPEKLQAEAMAQDLANAVASERKRMASFEDMLRQAVADGQRALGQPSVASLVEDTPLHRPSSTQSSQVVQTPASHRPRPLLTITPIHRDLAGATPGPRFSTGLITSTPYCSSSRTLRLPSYLPKSGQSATQDLDCTVDPLRKTQRRQLGSLEDRIEGLQQMLESEKKAAKLHDMHLRQASVLRPL